MSAALPLLMISAMYENGGNTTHRLLDGHPELFVYPFESQIGTRLVNDGLSAMFPVKYRWPVFALDASPAADYHAIIDEETKVRARTPHVSKFRHVPFEFSDDERREHYLRHVAESGRSAANNVGAFFQATFDAWKDRRRSGRERIYVGYSPIIVVDAATDPVADAERPRAARGAKSVVGLCGHQEAAGAVALAELHAALVPQPARRTSMPGSCFPAACISCASRT